jgi:bisphosphoglycerate-dependent phosphoglycerate mutase
VAICYEIYLKTLLQDFFNGKIRTAMKNSKKKILFVGEGTSLAHIVRPLVLANISTPIVLKYPLPAQNTING